MVQELLPDLYRIEIPLPNNPLKSVNSYLLKGRGRCLIIDTGMNRRECLNQMLSSLRELEVDLRKTDFFITHLHADHLGLIGDLATDTSAVYFNQTEASIVNTESNEEYWQEIYEFYLSHGFPEAELKESLDSHPGRRYRSQRRVDFSSVEEGDMIEIGDYAFRCLETRGHSPGHMCLFEPRKKILISGDHILFDITPNITPWPEMGDSLGEYLANLEKVRNLDVELVLPGHRNTCHDLKARISELQEHHLARLSEVLFALEGGDRTAFQVAPYISWDIDCASWELFPTTQKWFAVGEAVAHLAHLEEKGVVHSKTVGNEVIFSVNSQAAPL